MRQRLAPYLVAACVLAAAAGSSIQRQLFDVGRPARWLLLAALVAYALLHVRIPRPAPWTTFALAAFCGLALASTAWSVHWRGSAERAVVLTAVVAALVVLASARLDLVDGVVVAAAIVAVAGFLYWLVSSHAVLASTTEYGARFQGIEQSPNTAAALYAIALPLTLGRAFEVDGRARAACVAVVVVLAASLAAAGSRGAILAAGVGALVVGARLRRLAAVALVLAGIVVVAWTSTLAKPKPGTAPTPPTTTLTSRDAEATLPQSQEIGNPWWTRRAGDSKRSLFSTSVRLRALKGSLRVAEQRPLLGFGFGTDQWAFYNRYYAFDSSNPEDAYAGTFLQLGVVGLACVLAVLALCVWPALRRPVAPAALGGAVGGIVLGISQSYFHGVGSIEWLALWVSLLTCAVAR